MRYSRPHMRSYVWNEYDTNLHRERQVHAYAKWIEELLENGWNAFILTIMFRQLAGSTALIRSQMMQEAERIIWWLSEDMVRNPWSEIGWKKLPRVFYSLDWPVYKRDKKLSKQIIRANNGLHVQGILLKRKSTLLRQSLLSYVAEYQDHLRGKHNKVDVIDVKPIDRTPRVAGEYVLKAYQRRLIDDSGIMVLPKSLSEMRCRN